MTALRTSFSFSASSGRRNGLIEGPCISTGVGKVSGLPGAFDADPSAKHVRGCGLAEPVTDERRMGDH
ncbi:MAG: hypothetical protein SA339_08080 [Methanomassiliicoccus sp.]|nr:hypothetical protein [Methanomassiliicoccus sp.]